MMTKSEREFTELANKWLADTLPDDETCTVVWNAISSLCRCIATENHDALEVFIAESVREDAVGEAIKRQADRFSRAPGLGEAM